MTRSTAKRRKKTQIQKCKYDLLGGFDPHLQAGDQYVYDHAKGMRAVRFIEGELTFTKGVWKGKPFTLKPWQRQFILCLFGWIDKDTKFRRFSMCLLYIPRKNGKSQLVSAIANFVFHLDEEPDNEIYIAAKTSGQASTLYNMARLMNEQNPLLDSEVEYNKTEKATKKLEDETIMKVVSSDGEAIHSTSPGLGIVDELHTQKKNTVISALMTGMGARQQPLYIEVTTASIIGENICNQRVGLAREVISGEKHFPTFMPVVFEKRPEEEWDDPKTWARVNPSYPEHPSHQTLMNECMLAKLSKVDELDFRQYHLNEQVSAEHAWLDIDQWNQGQKAFTEEELEGQKCFASVDLAQKADLVCVAYYFPELRYIKKTAFIPRRAIKKGFKENRELYQKWYEQKVLKFAGERRIDYDVIVDEVLEADSKYDIIQVAYDPWNAHQFSVMLFNAGMDIVQFPQNMRTMNEPSKEFEAMIIEGSLYHDDPILDWMAGHVHVYRDNNENIKPVKPPDAEAKKIDGIICAIMAIGVANAYDEEGEESIYNTRDLEVIDMDEGDDDDKNTDEEEELII